LEEIIFENFNIFENNIINVELAKALRYDKLVFNLSFVTLGMWIILEYPKTKKDFLKSIPMIKCLNQFSFFVEILCNDMKKWLKYVLYGGHQMGFVLQHVEFCIKFSFLLNFM
jgi:hypothetical protein